MPHIVPVEGFTAPNYEIEREIVNTEAQYVRIEVIDPRHISDVQRMKARALIGDISRWSGQPADYLHEYMKYDFCVNNDVEWFSPKDCDVTTARHYITYLIEFCLCHGVPMRKPPMEMADDLEAAAYYTIVYRKCIVCGAKNCDIHHVDAIGMGMDRRTVVHEGMRAQALCRVHHTECHTTGQGTFDGKYHLVCIPLDKYLCLKLGLNFEAN